MRGAARTHKQPEDKLNSERGRDDTKATCYTEGRALQIRGTKAHGSPIIPISTLLVAKVKQAGDQITKSGHTNLLYLEATIRETMRIETLTPLSTSHKCPKKTMLGDYEIPANTPIYTNLAAMHHDSDWWGDPKIFRPERFLKEDGQLVKDFTLPFNFDTICSGYSSLREPSSLEDKLPGLTVSPKELWIRLESH
ncbi:hypothetical protein ALC60_13283 [Trachymyrmex zeteki]|uniref:Uncharacterized protein n=1 Tax=Mycetomoellerius zeteki TaxID=64791 RepID=A0A151WI67_9HYME|nr:hypothetical protein ALC60_13283 [Trachymyrmex zeteki]